MVSNNTSNEGTQQRVQYRFRSRKEAHENTKLASTSECPGNNFVEHRVRPQALHHDDHSRLQRGQHKHFTHRHALVQRNFRENDNIQCKFCTGVISGSAHGCDFCDFYLHKVCFYIPREILHESHPEHPLSLIYSKKAGEFTCRACGFGSDSALLFDFNYHCSPCNFDLHIGCASVPTTLSNDPKYPLNLYYYFPFRDEIATLVCDICSKTVAEDSWLFYNTSSDHIAHFECGANEEYAKQQDREFLSGVQTRLLALQINSDEDPFKHRIMAENNEQQSFREREIKHFGHRHYLQLCNFQTKDSCICKICGTSIAGAAYGCKSCHYYLHKKKCSSLPYKIQHPSHPKHPLTLLSHSEKIGHFCCKGCSIDVTHSGYFCLICKFGLHIDCASLPKTIKCNASEERYPLNLFYFFPYKKELAGIVCDYCNKAVGRDQWVYHNQDHGYICHLQCGWVVGYGSIGGEKADRLLTLQIS